MHRKVIGKTKQAKAELSSKTTIIQKQLPRQSFKYTNCNFMVTWLNNNDSITGIDYTKEITMKKNTILFSFNNSRQCK